MWKLNSILSNYLSEIWEWISSDSVFCAFLLLNLAIMIMRSYPTHYVSDEYIATWMHCWADSQRYSRNSFRSNLFSFAKITVRLIGFTFKICFWNRKGSFWSSFGHLSSLIASLRRYCQLYSISSIMRSPSVIRRACICSNVNSMSFFEVVVIKRLISAKLWNVWDTWNFRG